MRFQTVALLGAQDNEGSLVYLKILMGKNLN